MFHLHLSISCVSSWSFPAAVSVPVFHVPVVMLSLQKIFKNAPNSILDTSVLVYGGRRRPCGPGRRPIRYGMVGGFSYSDSRAKYNLTESIPLQVERVAV